MWVCIKGHKVTWLLIPVWLHSRSGIPRWKLYLKDFTTPMSQQQHNQLFCVFRSGKIFPNIQSQTTNFLTIQIWTFSPLLFFDEKNVKKLCAETNIEKWTPPHPLR